MQAFYQAELRPDLLAELFRTRLGMEMMAFAIWFCN